MKRPRPGSFAYALAAVRAALEHAGPGALPELAWLDEGSRAASLALLAATLAHPSAPSPKWRALPTQCWPALEPLVEAVASQPALYLALAHAVEPLAPALDALDASGLSHWLALTCEAHLASANPATRLRHGAFFTPPELAAHAVSALDALCTQRAEALDLEGTLCLEPAVGAGAMLEPPRSRALPREVLALDVLPVPLLVTLLRAWLSGRTEGLTLHLGDALTELAPEGALGPLAGRVGVVLGNPPWSGHGARTGRWGEALSAIDVLGAPGYFTVDGAPLGERNPKWLHDDYVRFVRLAQVLIARRGRGATALVCSHGWLDQPTFRGVRASLLHTFTQLEVLDLGGNARRATDTVDEGVFTIRPGACVLLAARGAVPPVRRLATLSGTRESKLALLRDTPWSALPLRDSVPVAPAYLLRRGTDAVPSDWREAWPLSAFFARSGPAVVTGRDRFVVDVDRARLLERMAALRDGTEPSQTLRTRFLRPGDALDLESLRARLAQASLDALVVPCAYRPLDARWLLLCEDALERARTPLTRALCTPGALSLVARRRAPPGRPGTYAWVARGVVLDGILRADNLGTERVYPLLLANEDAEPSHNFTPEAVRAFEDAWGLRWTSALRGDLRRTLGPADAFAYLYALLWSTQWRTRYGHALTEGEPRLALLREPAHFTALCAHGHALLALHADPADLSLAPALALPGDGEAVRLLETERERAALAPGFTSAHWKLAVGSYDLAPRFLATHRGQPWSATLRARFTALAAVLEGTLRTVASLDAALAQGPALFDSA